MIPLNQYDCDGIDSLIIQNEACCTIEQLSIDTRSILYPSSTLFFAFSGNLSNGHQYISIAYQGGVRNFVVSDLKAVAAYTDINYIHTDDVVKVLQRFAKMKRNLCTIPVIGITGSNGKTIVKEWLSILLSKQYAVVKTQKSNNSQIGVPLSVWQMDKTHTIGIFEAGISKMGEMQLLADIIQPTLGIFTNIGQAHQEGFSSIEEKIKEKIILFSKCKTIIACSEHSAIIEALASCLPQKELITWGYKSNSDLTILQKTNTGDSFTLKFSYKSNVHHMSFAFAGDHYFENLMHCITAALYLGLSVADIADRIVNLHHADSRLAILEGSNGNTIISDIYTNDVEGLAIALHYLKQKAIEKNKVAILAYPQNLEKAHVHLLLQKIRQNNEISFLLLGKEWLDVQWQDASPPVFEDSNALRHHLQKDEIYHSHILLKGSANQGLESISDYLASQSHSVTMEIDLDAIAHNLSVYASHLKATTEIVPILKANAYGAGSIEIARVLQHKGVKTIGVAFADEAVALRHDGITLPIIVLNADPQSFYRIHEYGFELEIYSIDQLKAYLSWKNGVMMHTCPIHIKLDTGMSRLGFRSEDIEELISLISEKPIKVVSIFSHLSSSEDSQDDAYTHKQAQLYLSHYDKICTALGYRPKRHLLNSAGILRFADYHFDQVRLGLGLYGIDSSQTVAHLEKVHTLIAHIIQIKKVKAGDYIGYNRKYKIQNDTTIGILNIGYADGLIRKAGNERYSVSINGRLCKIIGNVCMDLTIVDLASIEANIYDKAIVFGKTIAIEDLAHACDTIPYEILTRISSRIKRKYLG